MITDCPSAMTLPEMRLLQHFARGRKVVEVGALLGYSTIKLAQVATQVVSIDRHVGYSGDTWRRFRSNLERAAVSNRVIPIRGSSWLAACVPTDFAFIDLTGTVEDTYSALMAIKAPIVAVHDLCRANCKGVEIAMNWAGLKPIAHVDTLGICIRP